MIKFKILNDMTVATMPAVFLTYRWHIKKMANLKKIQDIGTMKRIGFCTCTYMRVSSN